MKRLSWISLLLLMAAAPAGWSQVSPPATDDRTATISGSVNASPSQAGAAEPDENGSSSNTGPYVPAPIDPNAPPLIFSSEGESSNWLLGNIRIGSLYNDNLFSSPTNKVGGFGYMLSPSLALSISRPRLKATFSYSPAFSIYQRISQYNQANQNVSGDIQYLLLPHVSIRLRDSYIDSSNIFDHVGSNPYTPGIGVLHQPNQSVIAPFLRQIGNVGSADIAYQFAPNSVVGASTTISRLRYGDVGGINSAGLNSTHSNAVDGFYSYHPSAKHWIGVDYDFNQYSFLPGNSKTVTHTVLLYDTISLSSHMTLSLFAGPQHSATEGEVVQFLSLGPFVFPIAFKAQQQAWGWSGGATYSWQGTRTAVEFSAVRRVSDGAGFFTAVRQETAQADIRRRLTERVTGTIGASANQDQFLGFTPTNISQIRMISGLCGLEYQLPSNLALNLNYERDVQRYGFRTNANRASISLSYQFRHPLGK